MRMRACKMKCLTSYRKTLRQPRNTLRWLKKSWVIMTTLYHLLLQSRHQKTVQSVVGMMKHQNRAGNYFERP